jgi:phosphatidylglycerophosphate synthase
MKMQEAGRSLVFKTQRHIGLYAAYMLHRLKVSANILDIIRVILAVLAVSLLWMFRTDIWLAGVAVLLMYLQVFLDFVDGALARLSGPACFGEEMDGLPNELSRSSMFILLGMCTENFVLVFISVAVACVLIGFLERTASRIPISGFSGLFRKITYRLLSVVFMLIVLPGILLTCIGFNVSLIVVSYVLLGIYVIFAALWLVLCAVKK